jgi:hypothetical protein
MFALLRLPAGSGLLVNDISRILPPYNHGQLLVRLRLSNGIVIEASWDDEKHGHRIAAYEAEGNAQLAGNERFIVNREWVPAAVNTIAWELAFRRTSAATV